MQICSMLSACIVLYYVFELDLTVDCRDFKKKKKKKVILACSPQTCFSVLI